MTYQKPDRFDEALKSWAEQPPPTPADEAARQVVARLPERGSRQWLTGSWPRLATAAAGFAFVLVVGWATLNRSADLSPAVAPKTQEVALPPLSENVVLLWLDEETPLYLTVAAPATEGGS